jgi:two-component system chemotaxis response regulator CheY
MRILIAEDDRPSRRLLTINLRERGHEVIETEDGEQAWETLQKESARMLITDWMMPLMSGVDLTQKIRAELKDKYTYIILLTALADKSQIVEGLNAGVDDYLTKPYMAEELHARVKIGERILQLEERLRDATEQMQYLAMHDSLTGILNRRAIQEHAEAEARRATRIGTPLGLIMIDLDLFKTVNDQYGHAAGDQALRSFTEIVHQIIRSYDWLGRWGGEEFLIILPGVTSADAVNVAERIRISVETARQSMPDGQQLRFTVSLGVACASPDKDGGIQVNKLIQSADEALYTAKSKGRNQVCLAG